MSEITKEQEEAVTREMDSHAEARHKAIENSRCLKCQSRLLNELNERNIIFRCSDPVCKWFIVYPIRTLGNSERAQRDGLDQEFSIHQLAEIRSAILMVVDDGCDCESGEKHPWEFYEDGTEGGDVDAYTEDMANANRLRFVNAVQSRLTATLKGNRG